MLVLMLVLVLCSAGAGGPPALTGRTQFGPVKADISCPAGDVGSLGQTEARRRRTRIFGRKEVLCYVRRGGSLTRFSGDGR